MALRSILIRFLLLLQLLNVSITLATEDEAWQHVPEIPAGRRTQYLLLKKDGSYKYGYDTGSSFVAKQSASPGNEVSGNYGYTDANGIPQSVQYTSGVNGFIPKLDGSTSGSLKNHYVSSKGVASNDVHGGLGSTFGSTATHNRHDNQKNAGHNVFVSYNYKGHGGHQNVAQNSGINSGLFNSLSSQQQLALNEDNNWQKTEVPSYQETIPPDFHSSGTAPDDLHHTYSTQTPGEEDEESSGFGDASYSFSYSADDHSRSESSDAQGNVQGSYSYVAPTGTEQRVDYEAGANTGFVIKKVSSQPAASVPKTFGSGTPSYPPLPNAIPPPSSPKEVGNSDASYSFSYNAGDHSRTESSDANGNVQGSYSFTTQDDGVQRKVDYSAGSGTGFLATGSILPGVVAPESHLLGNKNSFDTRQSYVPIVPPPVVVPSSPASNDGSYSFSYNAGDHSRTETSDAVGNVKGSFSFVAKDDGLNRKVDYSAGPEAGFIAVGDHIPRVPQSPTHSLHYPSPPSVTKTLNHPTTHQSPQHPSEDGSYSFTYDAGDHSRSESSDALGNVKGSFSFVAKDDGVSRKVDYSAGSATGFVAVGDHLPVPPQSLPTGSKNLNYPTGPSTHNIAPSLPTASDGSYSFSYDAGDHSRSESSDSLGNVKGTFSFVSKDDGAPKRVDYSAGSATGFTAVGEHLPLPQTPNIAPLSPIVPVPPTITQQVIPPYRSNIPTFNTPSLNPPLSDLPATTNNDRSYSFSYDAGDHSRTEVVDSDGNVQGSYSFVAKDGVPRKVDYSAGSANGFIATGAHLPVPPTNTADWSQSNSGIGAKGRVNNTPHQAGSSDQGHGDASYSYSYETDSSSKHETSDSAGNVQGSFTYIGGDGVSRTVQYTANPEEGFIATGAHLPKHGTFENSVDQEQQTLPPPTGSEFRKISHSVGHNALGIKDNYKGYKEKSSSQQNNISGKGYSLYTYLPTDSEKFGYIFDTKQN